MYQIDNTGVIGQHLIIPINIAHMLIVIADQFLSHFNNTIALFRRYQIVDKNVTSFLSLNRIAKT